MLNLLGHKLQSQIMWSIFPVSAVKYKNNYSSHIMLFLWKKSATEFFAQNIPEV